MPHHDVAWAGPPPDADKEYEAYVQQQAQEWVAVTEQPAHDPGHQAINWLVTVIPGGGVTILAIVGWALRARIRNWIVGVIRDATKPKG